MMVHRFIDFQSTSNHQIRIALAHIVWYEPEHSQATRIQTTQGIAFVKETCAQIDEAIKRMQA